MPYEIGKVFSDAVTGGIQRRNERSGGGSIARGRKDGYGYVGGRGAATVDAARIRADQAAADRDSRERLAGMSEGRKAETSGRALDIREGELERKARHDAVQERLRAVAIAAEDQLARVRTTNDGIKVLGWLMAKAREKDAYGRVDPEQVAGFGKLIDAVRTRLISPTSKGGYGLPGEEIDAMARKALGDLNAEFGGSVMSAGATVSDAGAPPAEDPMAALGGMPAAPAAPQQGGGLTAAWDASFGYPAPAGSGGAAPQMAGVGALEAEDEIDLSWADALPGTKPPQIPR